MKKSIRLIYTLYALSIVIIIVISALFFFQFESLTSFSAKVNSNYQMKLLLRTLQHELVQAENNQLDYLIRKDERKLEPEKQVQDRILGLVEKIEALVGDHPDQRPNLIKLKSTVSDKFLLMAEVWRSADTDVDINYDRYFNEGRVTMADFQRLALAMEEQENKLLVESSKQKKTYERAAPVYLFLILTVTCVFQVLSFAFILRQFRQRHSYQRQLEENIKELNRSNAELEQIVFVASHNLQEPLRKIQTFSKRVLQQHTTSVDDEGAALLDKINNEAARVQGLMADLVNYSTLFDNELPGRPVNLNKCLDFTIDALKLKVNAKKAAINRQILPTVTGQEKQLQLLFFHLLDNALKFTSRHVQPVINITRTLLPPDITSSEVGETVTGNYHRISISDNGIGFEEEYAHKIFFLFQRLHTQNSAYQGKGLGLAISKRIVTNHDGFITASGEAGTGATFNIYLPENGN